jgi:hypothetical protein
LEDFYERKSMKRQVQIIAAAAVVALSAMAPQKPRVKIDRQGRAHIAAEIMPTAFAAAGYSLIYLVAGGGYCGAIIIFFIAQRCWSNEFLQNRR